MHEGIDLHQCFQALPHLSPFVLSLTYCAIFSSIRCHPLTAFRFFFLEVTLFVQYLLKAVNSVWVSSRLSWSWTDVMTASN